MTETTRTTKDTAIMIKVSNLYPHPDNPRKDLGDLTELVESIKKNGIMQNLTVIPIGNERDPEEQADAGNIALYSDFRVLIGHRRLAAAKKAGLESVPCRIVSNISRSDQIGIMLEENMQRNDLSIYEQAQSFQMMLALLPDSLKGIDLVDWQGYYNQEKAGTFKMVIRALVPYGFSITEEDEKQILDGTHELYAVKEK